MNNNEITAVTTEGTSDGYAGQFKVLYPVGSIQGCLLYTSDAADE